MKTSATILSLALATSVAGHGYLYVPSSRERLGNEVLLLFLFQPQKSNNRMLE